MRQGPIDSKAGLALEEAQANVLAAVCGVSTDRLEEVEKMADRLACKVREAYRYIKGNRAAGIIMTYPDAKLLLTAILRICLEELEETP